MYKAPQEFTISETKYSICITPTYMYFYKGERSTDVFIQQNFVLCPINITGKHDVQVKIVL
jgi:hypothetical protein